MERGSGVGWRGVGAGGEASGRAAEVTRNAVSGRAAEVNRCTLQGCVGGVGVGWAGPPAQYGSSDVRGRSPPSTINRNTPRAVMSKRRRSSSSSEDDPVGLGLFLRESARHQVCCRHDDDPFGVFSRGRPTPSGPLASSGVPSSVQPPAPAASASASSQVVVGASVCPSGSRSSADVATPCQPLGASSSLARSSEPITRTPVEGRPLARTITRVRSEANSVPERLPLTGKPVDDGLAYTDGMFSVQCSLARDDPFLSVQLPAACLSREEQFSHARDKVAELLRESGRCTVYSIGITRGPSYRFHRDDYGYFKLGFTGMWVLFRGPPHWAAELERMLIKEHKGKSGCQNIHRGGENAPPRGIGGWLYVAWASVADGRSVVKQAKQRTKESRLRSWHCMQAALRASTPDS